MATLERYRPSLIAAAILMVSLLLDGAGIPAADSAQRRRERADQAAIVEEYPYRHWNRAYEYESDYYSVKTNTSRDVAAYIGQLMDFAQKNYQRIFRYEGEMPRLKIFAYRTDKEYQAEARKIGLGGSAGFFAVNGGDKAIHVAYTKTYGLTQPTHTLLHEGAHQFVHMAFGFPVPPQFEDYFVKGLENLPSVPLWLNEGIATYMENSYYDGDNLVVGEININRLRQLQAEMRENRYVTLDRLFKQHDAAKFTPSHYASAWGIVYWFRHDADPDKRTMKRRILKNYMRECRRGFMDDPMKEFEKFLVDDFAPKWRAYIARASQDKLVSMTIGRKGDIDKWDSIWRKWILALDPDDPYGGIDSD